MKRLALLTGIAICSVVCYQKLSADEVQDPLEQINQDIKHLFYFTESAHKKIDRIEIELCNLKKRVEVLEKTIRNMEKHERVRPTCPKHKNG